MGGSPASTSDWLERCTSSWQDWEADMACPGGGNSFCGQMHSLVVLDKADRVVRPAFARVTGGAAQEPSMAPNPL